MLVLMAVWGLICYAALAQRSSGLQEVKFGEPINRSWVSGSLSVDTKLNGGTLWFVLRGAYPDAGNGLQIKYNYWVQPEVGKPAFVRGGLRPLAREFEDAVSGYYFREGEKRLVGVPVRVLLDYEIWEGEVSRGTLLQKDSIYSEPFTLPRGDEL